jgi:hypothetical protein
MKHRRRRILRVLPTRRCECGEQMPCPDAALDYGALRREPDGQTVLEPQVRADPVAGLRAESKPRNAGRWAA